MFLFVLLISAVAVVVSVNDPVINDVDNVQTERKRVSPDIAKNGVNHFDLMAEIVALIEIVNKQGQEMDAIKHETKELKETTYQQGLLINVLNQEKTELRDKILKQEKHIVDMVDEMNVIQRREASVVVKVKEIQEIIDQQDKNIKTMGKDINVLKKTLNNQNSKVKEFAEFMKPEVLWKQPSDTVLNKQELPSEEIKKDFNSSTKHLMKTGPVHTRRYKIAKAKGQTTKIAFSAYLSHILSNLTTGHTIKCDQILTNIGNGYNAHTGVFTAPSTGVYLFTFFINSYGKNSVTYVRLVVDDRNIFDAVAIPFQHDIMGGNTAVLEITAGEAVWLETFRTTTGQLQSDNAFRYVTFSGVFLYI